MGHPTHDISKIQMISHKATDNLILLPNILKTHTHTHAEKEEGVGGFTVEYTNGSSSPACPNGSRTVFKFNCNSTAVWKNQDVSQYTRILNIPSRGVCEVSCAACGTDMLLLESLLIYYVFTELGVTRTLQLNMNTRLLPHFPWPA